MTKTLEIISQDYALRLKLLQRKLLYKLALAILWFWSCKKV